MTNSWRVVYRLRRTVASPARMARSSSLIWRSRAKSSWFMAGSSFHPQAYHSPGPVARKVPVFVRTASLPGRFRTVILVAEQTKAARRRFFFYGQYASGHRHRGVQRAVHPWPAGRGPDGPGGGAPVRKPAGAPERPRLLGPGPEIGRA